MLLLRSMPDLTPQNTAFRTWFYSRWGRENSIILGRSRHAEYARFRQRLSIKMATGGSERYFVDGRSIAVDDDSFLVLNDGNKYGSLIHSESEVESFCVFFRPGLLDEVRADLDADGDQWLDGEQRTASAMEFAEQLTPHDSSVSPVMRFIRHHVRAGVDDERWYDEQFNVLAERLLVQQRRVRTSNAGIDCVKASTRIELQRRLALAADFILSNYDRDIGLEQMAAAACLSVHHFLRLFRAMYRLTPMQFLYRKRIQVALRMQRDGRHAAQEIASRVGFNSRATFYRQLRRWQAQKQKNNAAGMQPEFPLVDLLTRK